MQAFLWKDVKARIILTSRCLACTVPSARGHQLETRKTRLDCVFQLNRCVVFPLVQYIVGRIGI